MPLPILAAVGLFIAVVAGGGAALYVHHVDKSTVAPKQAAGETEAATTTGIQVNTNAPIVEKAAVGPATKAASEGTIAAPSNPVATVSSIGTLQIEGVQAHVDKNGAVITWTTSVVAESQLILDNGEGKGFESKNGAGTEHEVDITGLTQSAEYDYEIVAKTPDKRQLDNYYGSFSAVKTYVARLGELDDKDNCQQIFIEDTAGKPAVGMNISVTGAVVAHLMSPIKKLTTDGYGSVEYCNGHGGPYRITGPNDLDTSI